MAKKNWFYVVCRPAGMSAIIPVLLLGVVLAGCPGTGTEPTPEPAPEPDRQITSVTVTGTATVGNVLTASADTNAAFQWKRGASKDGSYTNISGATRSTYTITATDAGKWLKVEASNSITSSPVSSTAQGPVGDRPKNTIKWQSPTDGQGGDYQLYTNDTANYSYYYTRWENNARADGNTNIFEIEVKKISGYVNMGYGMIFAVTESTVGGRDVQDYYRVLITTDGYYRVSKTAYDSTADGDYKYTTYFPADGGNNWPKSTALKAGDANFNKIKIVRAAEGTGNKFTLYFNDTQVNTFTDNSPLTGQKIGFYVSVGKAEDEDFPNNPVDVRFKKVK